MQGEKFQFLLRLGEKKQKRTVETCEDVFFVFFSRSKVAEGVWKYAEQLAKIERATLDFIVQGWTS